VALELIPARIGGDPPADLRDLHVHPLPRPAKGRPIVREQESLAANASLRDTLHRHGPWDAIYERYSLWSFAGMEYAAEAGISGLLEVNAPLIEEQAEHRELHDRAGAVSAAERALAAASAVIAVSQEVASYLKSFSAAGGKVSVVPNGVDPRRFPPGLPPRRPRLPGVFTVGFVGTLKPWHGVSLLLEALAKLRGRDPRYHGLIVGDGPERASLVEQTARDPLLCGTVEFAGAVPPDDIPGLLASMDVAAAPYPRLPGFYFSPLKLYEYLAAGRPVVASRIGQLETVIRDGVNGLLCKPGDAAALAAAIEQLQRSPALCRRLGQVGRESVLEGHSWEKVAEQILALARTGRANTRGRPHFSRNEYGLPFGNGRTRAPVTTCPTQGDG
jgi:glycosyltransferase involved in cell wall biosynthesis